jgi:hypothetical protein
MMRLWAVLQHISFPKVVAAFRYRSVLSTYSNIFLEEIPSSGCDKWTINHKIRSITPFRKGYLKAAAIGNATNISEVTGSESGQQGVFC